MSPSSLWGERGERQRATLWGLNTLGAHPVAPKAWLPPGRGPGCPLCPGAATSSPAAILRAFGAAPTSPHGRRHTPKPTQQHCWQPSRVAPWGERDARPCWVAGRDAPHPWCQGCPRPTWCAPLAAGPPFVPGLPFVSGLSKALAFFFSVNNNLLQSPACREAPLSAYRYTHFKNEK